MTPPGQANVTFQCAPKVGGEASEGICQQALRLSVDKTAFAYNDWLTPEGIPAEAFRYWLGNRSALEWVIDQYYVSTDSRSSSTNDPNCPDDPQYIVRLIGQVVTVSVETTRLVDSLAQVRLMKVGENMAG